MIDNQFTIAKNGFCFLAAYLAMKPENENVYIQDFV